MDYKQYKTIGDSIMILRLKWKMLKIVYILYFKKRTEL